MGGKLGKNWYRASQIFEVSQAHAHTILVKVTPPRLSALIWYQNQVHIPLAFLDMTIYV